MLDNEHRYRVFANRVFAGNPITLHEVDGLDDSAYLASVARESWSEDNVFFSYFPCGPIQARFFSSHSELQLCGHGLLALAYHVFGRDGVGSRLVQSASGTWMIRGTSQGPVAIMPMEEPLPQVAESHWMRKGLRRFLGCDPAAVHTFPNDVWVVVLNDLAQLRGVEAARVRSLRSDAETPGALIAVVPMRDGAYGFRYFAPWHGKVEDSGTGVAHRYLAPLFLAEDGKCRAMQFSKEGIAEMHIERRAKEIWLSGAVHTVASIPHRRLVSQLSSV